MKKILIALLGVLTLFACSQDELGNGNGKQEISLVKNSEFKIYSGKHDWLADAASTRAMSAHGKKAMNIPNVPDGATNIIEAYQAAYNDWYNSNAQPPYYYPNPNDFPGFELNDGGVYFVPAGQEFNQKLSASLKNASGNNSTVTIYVAGKMIVPAHANGIADFDITVLPEGELYWDWNGNNNGGLYIGNGGAARINCYGVIGTRDNNQTTTNIKSVTLKGGSYLNLFNTGKMKEFVVNGDFFCEANNGQEGEFYSEIPVTVKGNMTSNSASYVFNDEFNCEGNITVESHSEFYFNGCANVAGDVYMNGESDIYVEDYLSTGRISFDQGRMHLHTAVFSSGAIVIPAYGGNAYIESATTSAGNSKKKTISSDNLSLVDCDDFRFRGLGDSGNQPMSALQGNLVVKSAKIVAGDQFNVGKQYQANEIPVQAGVSINPNTADYYIPADDCHPAYGTDDTPVTYTLTALVVQGQEDWGTATGSATNIPAGTEKTVTATPKDGYEFVQWSDGSKDATHTIIINSDVTIYASFKKIIKTYDLLVDIKEGCEDWGEVTGTEENIPEGESKTFSATPKDGYEFVGWTDGNTDPVRTVTMDSDKHFTATFKEKENTPDPEDPYNNPKKPEYYENKAHVEVNLSVNDEKETGDYIATKLSIHVRDITDVEVFIPVSADYYCPADDMYIVALHDKEYVYNELTQQTQIEVAGQTVTLTVSFENGGIRVTTDGVNAEVIKYCRETYGDGITFEVWNYYKDNTTRDELKPMLDASTITFLDKEPDYYINAFAKLREYTEPIYNQYDEETGEWTLYTDEACTQVLDSKYWERTEDGYEIFGHKNEWDCVVLPVESRENGFYKDEDCVTGEYNKNYAKVPETEE